MPPALLLVELGTRWWIPLPLFLLWPFVAFAWLALTVSLFIAAPGGKPGRRITAAKKALSAFWLLSGTTIEVQSKGSTPIGFRVV